MRKQFQSFLISFFLVLSCIHCNDRQINNNRSGSEKARMAYFLEAKPVWIQGREREKNLTLGFRSVFDKPGKETVSVRIAASTLYRIFLNGQFIGHGPARAAHDFYRIDEWPLNEHLKEGANILAVEVAGYNVNSFYLLDQPSFLQAEITAGEQVLKATGPDRTDFNSFVIADRIQKVPRFSFQRPFIECYQLDSRAFKWRSDPSVNPPGYTCTEMPVKNLLVRGVPYSDFKTRLPLQIHSTGRFISGVRIEKYWKDRSLTQIGEKLGGYPENELTVNPSLIMQETETVSQETLNRSYDKTVPISLPGHHFSIVDFGVNLSGFIGATITCEKPSTVYFVFDEILSAGDVNFRRLGCINIVSYDLAPGRYQVETFEPYTMRYLKIVGLEGDCEVSHIYLREYANADIGRSSFSCSNDSLNKIYQAGRETFRQNALDIFMDCPSRERAGWLCDSYFTSRVAMDLSGNTLVEKNFYENFLLPEQFKFLPDGMLPMCYPADHPDSVFIPNWAMWFVVQLEEYGQRSGDNEMIEALKPKVLRLFHYFDRFKNGDGLLEDLESWIFVEWSEANKFVRDVNYPTNMLYSAALAAAGRLYDLPELADQAQKIRQTIIRQSFNGKFFIDNAVRNDQNKLEMTTNTTEVCQYYAFYFQLASPQTHPELWQILLNEFKPDRKKNNYPDVFRANAFIGNYLRLELLSRYGQSAPLLRESLANFYYMAQRTGTLWENIGAYASCNHGFASHVVHVLYRDILGIFHIDYINKKITLRFPDIQLDSCRGQLPIGDQVIDLAWEKKGGQIEYTIKVPDGYSVDVPDRPK